MISVLEETYREALSTDPTLETPSYMKLGEILYKKLSEKISSAW
jgi:hypothetical protein